MASFKENKNNMLAPTIPAPAPVRDRQCDHDIVLEALSRPEYMWRTAEGIAHETNIPVKTVNEILNNEMNHCVIRSAVPDKKGRTRYTTLRHYRAHAGILRRVLDTLSDQVR